MTSKADQLFKGVEPKSKGLVNTLHLNVTPELYAKITVLCKKTGKSRTAIVRKVLEDAFTDQGETDG